MVSDTNDGNKNKTDTIDLDSLELDEGLVEASTQFFEDVIREVFASKKEFFVHAVAQKLRNSDLAYAQAPDAGQAVDEWIAIESLSRLRSVVGGRFQNLKKRWIEAGLPLRQHRGDKGKAYTISKEGWMELCNWILKQGFEARLSDDKTTYLFELKAIKKDHQE
ncbi:hypothetical protein OAO01_01780 [Oligoflexia bacterium]|nr:hypothetical protein [Oligoflexia bacterium]